MRTVFARRRRAHGHAELSVGTILIALVAGLLLVCATSRTAAES